MSAAAPDLPYPPHPLLQPGEHRLGEGEATITLSEFILGILGIIVILLSYLAELVYHVLNAGFPI